MNSLKRRIDFVRTNRQKISDLIKEINKKGFKSLDEIQEFLQLDTNYDAHIARNIVDIVLQAKLKEKRLALKSDFFSKQLKVYIPYEAIPFQSLTNDSLYFEMIKSKIIDQKDYTPEEKGFLNKQELDSITLVSQNFNYGTQCVKGLIQDYDPKFSVICRPGIENADDIVAKVLDEKPGLGHFAYKGENYSFCGLPNICLIYERDLTDDEIKDKVKKVRFLHTEKNVFALGEKNIDKTGQLKYVFKNFKPDSFCPAFFSTPDNVMYNLLIELSVSYEDLFEYLSNILLKNSPWPGNLCYWDTFDVFFSFLSVFVLTNQDVPEDQKIDISLWIDEYQDNRSGISLIKKNHQKVESLFKEFYTLLMNTGDLKRLLNLLDKSKECIEEHNKFIKFEWYNGAIAFLRKMPFCKMIQNQLKGDIFITLGKMKSALEGFGAALVKSEVVVGNLRSVANEIYSYLPKLTMNDVCFPFIVPRGSISGEMINIGGNNDPFKQNVEKSIQKSIAQRTRSKAQAENEAKKLASREDVIIQYVTNYLADKHRKSKNKYGPGENEAIARYVVSYINFVATPEERQKFLMKALSQSARNKEDKLIDEFLRDYSIGYGKGKKPREVGVKFFKAAQAMNSPLIFKNEIKSSAMDIESEDEDEKK